MAGERKAGGFLQQSMKIVIIACRVGRHRRMEEPAFADIDSAEELPIAVKIGMNDAIGRAWRKALELVVQLARAEQRQHHQLIKIGAAARYAGLFAHDRMRAVA